MNNSIIKVLTAGKRIGTDGPRELIPTLVERLCLDGDEFSLKAYIRGLEEILNDEDTSDEMFYETIDRITFLGGTVEWDKDPWNKNREYIYVHL